MIRDSRAEAAGDGAAPGSPVAILTRPAGQSQFLQAALERRGWQVQDWPALLLTTLATHRLPDPATFDLVMFVSGNAVRHFAAQRRQAGQPGWPAGVPKAVVGPASAAACRAVFPEGMVIQPAAESVTFDSEALWQVLERQRMALRRVLIVRGGDGIEGRGRTWLADRWREQGVEIVLHSAYHREPASWPATRWQQVTHWQKEGRTLVWLWSSREGLEAVRQQAGLATLLEAWRGSRLLLTHPRLSLLVRDWAQRGDLATVSSGAPPAGQDPASLVLQVCVPQDDALLAAFVQ